MKQMKKNTHADFILAMALILGSVVLAAVSWWLPGHFRAPMTADMRGTVEAVQEAYSGTRLALCLEGNSVKYTLPAETFLAMEFQPEPGDKVKMTYEISSTREIRDLKLSKDGGAFVVLYTSENPLAKQLYFWQTIAFAVFGVYAAACVGGYLVQKKRRKE